MVVVFPDNHDALYRLYAGIPDLADYTHNQDGD